MSNQNVADLSTFEGLQNQAHAGMGMPQSQMAVFNGVQSKDDIDNEEEKDKKISNVQKQINHKGLVLWTDTSTGQSWLNTKDGKSLHRDTLTELIRDVDRNLDKFKKVGTE